MTPFFLLCLLALAAFFSSAETTFFSLSWRRVPFPPRVRNLLEKPLEFLSLILLGSTLTNMAFSALATAYFVSIWKDVPLVWLTSLITLLVLVFGELLPKTIAAGTSEKIAPIYAPFLSLLSKILRPIAIVFARGTEFTLSRLFGKRQEGKSTSSREEIEEAIRTGAETGWLSRREWEILEGILAFGEKTAEEIMTPRTEIVALPVSATADQAVTLFSNEGVSRLPVYLKTHDDIIGVLYAKDLLRCTTLEKKITIRELLRPVFVVPEGITLERLLAEFRRRRTHIALVADEYGGTTGLVTLEDVLEEIVGEIWDEHDLVFVSHQQLKDGGFLLSAGISRNELARLGIILEEGHDNLSAYLLAISGHIPQQGEVFETEHWRFSIVKASPQRIELIRAERCSS